MRKDILEDKIFIELKEAWNDEQSDVADAGVDQGVYFGKENIVKNQKGSVTIHVLVKNEQDQDSYISVDVPTKPDILKKDGDRFRISSKWLAGLKSSFNNGNYAKGHRVYDKSVENEENDKPKNKLGNIQVLSTEVTLPKYIKSIDVVTQGVKINPKGELKKAIETAPGHPDHPQVVKVDGHPCYLVMFQINDENEHAIRVNPEQDQIITSAMPVPLSSINSFGIINPGYVNEFVQNWNAGKRYKYDERTREGHFEQVQNPHGNPLSVAELSNKLVDLDRTKAEHVPGDAGTGGADVQRQRLQVNDKKLIDDEDIAKAEQKLGKQFTRKEFLEFVRGKGLITPEAFRPGATEEYKVRALTRWLQANPRIASYLKSRKRARGGFAGGIGKHETLAQAGGRMANAQDAEEFIIDDKLFDKLGIHDNAYAVDDGFEQENPVQV